MLGVTLQEKLEEGLAEMNLHVSADKQAKLIGYLHLIHKWNQVHNLTAVRDPLDMVTLHLLDSLSVLQHIKDEGANRMLDVGAGAGLPSIPLAICMPELQITAIDAVMKKTSFMRQAKGNLDLNNFHVETGRVEALKDSLGFDLIISRAFSEMPLFVKLTKHLLLKNGIWMAMKGVAPLMEIEKLGLDNFSVKIQKVVPLIVSGLKAERHLVFLSPLQI